jgi:hypothetical protein
VRKCVREGVCGGEHACVRSVGVRTCVRMCECYACVLNSHMRTYVRASVRHVSVRALVRACVRACGRACGRAGIYVCDCKRGVRNSVAVGRVTLLREPGGRLLDDKDGPSYSAAAGGEAAVVGVLISFSCGMDGPSAACVREQIEWKLQSEGVALTDFDGIAVD